MYPWLCFLLNLNCTIRKSLVEHSDKVTTKLQPASKQYVPNAHYGERVFLLEPTLPCVPHRK